MAFVNQMTDDELQQQQQQQTQQPTLTGSPSAPFTGSTGDVSTPKAASQPVNRGGSQFSDVSRYLTQNQPQGQRLASKIGGNVISAGNQARQNIGTQQGNVQNALTTFNQGYQQNRPKPLDKSILDRVSSSPTSFFGATATPSSGPYPTREYYRGTESETLDKGFLPYKQFLGPTHSTAQMPTSPLPVSDQGGFDVYKGMLNAAYGGPTDLGYSADYSAIDPSVKQAGSLAEQYKTFSGREDLLGGLNKPNYSDAARNLDAVLLGAAPSRNILSKASGQNQDIAGRLDALKSLESGARQEASTKGAAGTQEAADIRGAAKGATDTAFGNLSQDYGGRLSSAQQEGQRLINQYGLNPEIGTKSDEQRALEEKLSGMLGGITNVASEEDYLKLAALNQLSGGNYAL